MTTPSPETILTLIARGYFAYTDQYPIYHRLQGDISILWPVMKAELAASTDANRPSWHAQAVEALEACAEGGAAKWVETLLEVVASPGIYPLRKAVQGLQTQIWANRENLTGYLEAIRVLVPACEYPEFEISLTVRVLADISRELLSTELVSVVSEAQRRVQARLNRTTPPSNVRIGITHEAFRDTLRASVFCEVVARNAPEVKAIALAEALKRFPHADLGENRDASAFDFRRVMAEPLWEIAVRRSSPWLANRVAEIGLNLAEEAKTAALAWIAEPAQQAAIENEKAAATAAREEYRRRRFGVRAEQEELCLV